MSSIKHLEWDSDVLGGRVGRVENYQRAPTLEEARIYWHSHVRIPQSEIQWAWQYQEIGFRFITIDYTLVKVIYGSVPSPQEIESVHYLSRKDPDFEIQGFSLSGSRLVIDPILRERLKRGFWDDMIRNHCREFADFVLCTVDERNRLIGLVSCFERSEDLELFLVIVHPECRGGGIGKGLLQAAEAIAHRGSKKRLITNVVSSNMEAMNFYLKNGFQFEEGHIIMHYSRGS